MATRDGRRVKLYADVADLATMQRLVRLPCVAGFTTNPGHMRTAGVKDYRLDHREPFVGSCPRMQRSPAQVSDQGSARS